MGNIDVGIIDRHRHCRRGRIHHEVQSVTRLAHVPSSIARRNRVAVGAAISELTDGEAPCAGCGIGGGGPDLRAVVVDRHRAAVLGAAGECRAQR
jgi:hypothetical protein